MRADLTPDERITVANAHLDQLIASVREHSTNNLLCVRQVMEKLADRPCNQTVDGHIRSLACSLALALFRLADEGQEQPWRH